MKTFVLVCFLGLAAAGCSRKENDVSRQTPVAVAADLAKNEAYFRGIYGAPQKEQSVGEYAFSLPGHGSLIRLRRPFTVQQYQSDKLQTIVVYSNPAREAIWVKYTLPNPWTPEQISAALETYGTHWESAAESPAMAFLLRDRAPTVYHGNTGILAYKTIVNELILYAPQLCADLENQIAEVERQKKAVPKF